MLEVRLKKQNMISIKEKLSINEQNALYEYLKKIFNINVLPSIDKHFIYLINNEMIGYCGIVKREIYFDNNVEPVYLLGLLSVDYKNRKKGIATKLLQCVQKNLTKNKTIILNCGNSIKELYEKNGYKLICEKALYYRNGKYENDNDPIYLWGRKLDKEKFNEIYIGTDF
jgi:predicted N-acetyltransferase YhbS